MPDQRARLSVDAAAVETKGPEPVPVVLTINGADHSVEIEPRVSLLSALRDHLDLTGSKQGCDQGTCGACTVWVDGRPVLACLTLAIACEGHQVTTVEGLASPGEPGPGQLHRGQLHPTQLHPTQLHPMQLHPMQEAFLRHDAFQCGYCTPGQLMSAVALVRDEPAVGDADIAEKLSGNLCRCAAYPHIRAAVRDVRDQPRERARGRDADAAD